MTASNRFPKFHCVISKKDEEFDSDVEAYFIQHNEVLAFIARLMNLDTAWKDNYKKIVEYLRNLEDSLINLKEPPSYKFLVDISSGEEELDNEYDRLLRATNENASLAFHAAVNVSRLTYWFVKLSKDPLYSGSFTLERYNGLPFLKLVLSYRSMMLSKQ
ncbi:MAG: hypothetical protein LVQ96_01010 [Thermoplasmatales archaeon]|nr:hypothetical protein [Thermoplasmatales archaeon]MCW6169736.1 hypothetical protein [Thermoplasmatales archaeon]